MQSVPLKRKFTPIPAAYQKSDLALDEVWSNLTRGENKSWDALLGEHRVVILAEAGAGKTYELQSAARRVISQGRPGFFIRIEDIDDDFGTAFEVGSELAFEDWLAGDDEAWFFLDSVDEIRLTEPRAFESAIRAFAKRIRDARQRAHIYISSRPYAWRPVLDRALIEEVLPFEPRRQETIGSDDLSTDVQLREAIEGAYPAVETSRDDSPPTLQLYQLAPLDEVEIRLFAEHSGVQDSIDFLAALERSRLFPLARLPFDLHDLLATWRETRSLASRLDILQEGVRRQLKLSLQEDSTLTLQCADEGAQLIAIAAVLTGRPNIRLPGSPGDEGIDAELLLPSWTSADIASLLMTGVFGEPIFGEVRFRHREIRELLAARWIEQQLKRSGGRHHVEMLIFSNQYGENILTPRLRPVLPWLILFNDSIRDRVLADHPEVAVEGGDAARLPVDVRRNILSMLIDQVIDPSSGLRVLDNAEIAKIAHADLQEYVHTLIDKYFDNDDAIFVLGRLVWQGEMRNCVASLSKISANPTRGIYARLISIRAVACLGSPDQLYALWRLLNTNTVQIQRRLLAELVDNAPFTAETIELFLASIDNSEPRKEFEVTGLTLSLNGFIQRLPLSSDLDTAELLFVFAEGLLRYLIREPFIERGHCHVSETFQWLMSPALHCIERLIDARSPAALSRVSLAILAATPALHLWRGDDYQERKSIVNNLVPEWPELNDALFWWTVTEYRGVHDEELKDDWPVSWMGHFWKFDETSFARTVAWIRDRKFYDDKLVALSRAVRIYSENDQPSAWLEDLHNAVAGNPNLEASLNSKLYPTTSPEMQRYQQEERDRHLKQKHREEKNSSARTKFVARLTANPDIIRHPPNLKPGQLSSEQYHLLQIIEGDKSRNSRTQGANWAALIPEFGVAVAEAYRDAAIAFWRAYKAGIRSEGADTSSIPYALIFAMSGLDIELRGSGKMGASLRKTDARRALRYVLWELNGFPWWFETFYRAWPKISRDFLWKEIEWELKHTPPEQALYYVLHDLVYYAPWLHTEFAPLLSGWLSQHPAPNHDCLRYCRAIMIGGGLVAADIATLSMRKIADTETPPEQLATWHALRTDADPARGVPAVKGLFDSGTLLDPVGFVSSFSVALIGGRRDVSPVFGLFKTPSYLKELYLLTHRTVRVADDIERAGKGVYSPTLRDEAQDARESLFALLTQIPGELTYRTILELSIEHPAPRYRDYMRTRAYERAVEDGDLPAWSESEVARLVQRLSVYPIIAALPNGAANAKA